MATAEEYAGWIVANADKKGTPEFETVSQAYQMARSQKPSIQNAEPAKQPAYDPTEGMSTFDKFMAGAGKAVYDVGRGIGQLTGQVSNADIEESRRLDKALMNTTAGTVGNVAGSIATALPTMLIPGANTIAGAGVIGSGMGLLQPSTSSKEAALNTVLGGVGGAAGQAAAHGLSSLAQNIGSAVTQGQRISAQGGQNLGMRLTPGKASGSTILQKIEAAAESNPITSGGFDALKENNQRILNRAAARAIGENADEVSTPIIERASTRLGNVFDSVADRTPTAFDPATAPARLRTLIQDTEGMIGNNASLADNPLINRLDDFIFNGGATREQLRDLSSKLGRAANNNLKSPNGDRELGSALFSAQDIVEDAIQGSLSPVQRAAYQEARGQYKNLMNLTSNTNVVNPSSGNVSGRNLASTLMRKDRGGFTLGRNGSDMYTAARFVQAHPDIVGNSGTATRSMGPTDYLAALPGGILSRLYLSRPVAAAASAGTGLAGITSRLAEPVVSRTATPVGALSALQLSKQ